MIYIILAILAGTLVVMNRIVNSNLALETGILQGTFINYATGLFFSIIFFFISKEFFDFSFVNLKSIPFYAYLGGLIGVMIVSLCSYLTPKMSNFYLTLLIFIGQIFAGIVLDYFISNSLSIGKIIGGLLVLTGLTINSYLDR
ncbi:MAG: DMT family transporter [Clostridiaceae bacterium]